jgi:hypothetical protein
MLMGFPIIRSCKASRLCGLLLTIFFILPMSACQRLPTQAVLSTTPSIFSTLKPTDTVFSITSTSTVTSTPITFTPTLTPTAIPSETPQPTATKFSPIYTPLPVPELSPQEIKPFIVQLIKDNTGCKLPCWWGITPGKTSWYDAYDYLKPLTSKITSSPSRYQPGKWINEIRFDVPTYIDRKGEIIQTFLTHDSTIDMIITDASPIQNYKLKDLLASFGIPSQVWLYTISEPREGILPYELLVFFEDQGIMAKYQGFARHQDSSVNICPDQTNPELWLWYPSGGVTFDLIERMISGDAFYFNYYFLPLNKATNVSLEEFHERFAGPTAEDCFTTPSEIW